MSKVENTRSSELPYRMVCYQSLPGRDWVTLFVEGDTPVEREMHQAALTKWASEAGFYAVLVLEAKAIACIGPEDTASLRGEPAIVEDHAP